MKKSEQTLENNFSYFLRKILVFTQLSRQIQIRYNLQRSYFEDLYVLSRKDNLMRVTSNLLQRKKIRFVETRSERLVREVTSLKNIADRLAFQTHFEK